MVLHELKILLIIENELHLWLFPALCCEFQEGGDFHFFSTVPIRMWNTHLVINGYLWDTWVIFELGLPKTNNVACPGYIFYAWLSVRKSGKEFISSKVGWMITFSGKNLD